MIQSVAILGSSGYAGGELIRLIDAHPALAVAYLGAHRAAGGTLGTVHPHLRGGDRRLDSNDAMAVPNVDLAFLALPHGASAAVAMTLLGRGIKVVDLGSDFRLDTHDRYLGAYGMDHPYPDQLGHWVYGLPEIHRRDIAASDRVASPGCYPTSAILPLGPLVAAGLIRPDGIFISSMSGVSGAGRGLQAELQFGAVDESVKAYKILEHRHQPEIERALDQLGEGASRVIFTPHLVPMQRGILTTIYASTPDGVTRDDLAAALEDAYRREPFVAVTEESPQTRWVVGSNRALISAHLDSRTGTAVLVSAIDNLTKGAAGQAVQSANLMLGLDETAGLPLEGWMP